MSTEPATSPQELTPELNVTMISEVMMGAAERGLGGLFIVVGGLLDVQAISEGDPLKFVSGLGAIAWGVTMDQFGRRRLRKLETVTQPAEKL